MDKNYAGGGAVLGLGIIIGVIFDQVALGIIFGLLFGAAIGGKKAKRGSDDA